MNASKALLEMLKSYGVSHVFGLPGETTLNLYEQWHDYPEIVHVMARDERSAVFMADGYAKVSYRPGVCEGPSVGATHMLPGVAEAFKASVPMVVFTSDIPLHLEKRNMLTGIDQAALFGGVTKETITVTNPSEIPHVIRRAFRLATGGRPGPIHIRLPMDVLGEEIDDPQIYAQNDFTKYPGHRSTAQEERIKDAVNLLNSSSRPVIVCGQGVLWSQAWDEVQTLAELYDAPVGTTISAKGSIPETHPLSIGVIGARGGTTLSNGVIAGADLILFIGCNTDSAATDKWTIPPLNTTAKIIHLDISEVEAGNNYPTEVTLIGDAKATLRKMIDASPGKTSSDSASRLEAIRKAAETYNAQISKISATDETPIHPLRFIRELTEAIPDDHVMVVDVGVSAIYTSTFFKVRKAGRNVLYNYAMGSLGYALPTSIGAQFARPDSCIVTMVGDGSFGFTAGELETLNRLGGNNNVILFNNSSFGWIKAAATFSHGPEYASFATGFSDVDYPKIAEGFGLKAYSVEGPGELGSTLKEAFALDEPTFIELKVMPEDELVPPVPSWIRRAGGLGLRYVG
jgi:acetolactate synthase-1/2/3 large subunit